MSETRAEIERQVLIHFLEIAPAQGETMDFLHALTRSFIETRPSTEAYAARVSDAITEQLLGEHPAEEDQAYIGQWPGDVTFRFDPDSRELADEPHGPHPEGTPIADAAGRVVATLGPVIRTTEGDDIDGFTITQRLLPPDVDDPARAHRTEGLR